MSAGREAVYAALEAVKGIAGTAPESSSLPRDLGLESIDVVDLFFEIEQSTGVVIELNQVIGNAQGSGRRFEDVSIQDLIDYLAARA